MLGVSGVLGMSGAAGLGLAIGLDVGTRVLGRGSEGDEGVGVGVGEVGLGTGSAVELGPPETPAVAP